MLVPSTHVTQFAANQTNFWVNTLYIQNNSFMKSIYNLRNDMIVFKNIYNLTSYILNWIIQLKDQQKKDFQIKYATVGSIKD